MGGQNLGYNFSEGQTFFEKFGNFCGWKLLGGKNVFGSKMLGVKINPKELKCQAEH